MAAMSQDDGAERAERERRARPRRKERTEEELHQERLTKRTVQEPSPRTAAADDCDRTLREIALEVSRLLHGIKKAAGVTLPWLLDARREIGRLRELLDELKRSKKGERRPLKATRAFVKEVLVWRRKDRRQRETISDLCKRLHASRPTFYRVLTRITDLDAAIASPIKERCRAAIARIADALENLMNAFAKAGHKLPAVEWVHAQLPYLYARIVALDRAKHGTRSPAKVTKEIRDAIAHWRRQDAVKRDTITAMCRRLTISRPTFRKMLGDLADG